NPSYSSQTRSESLSFGYFFRIFPSRVSAWGGPLPFTLQERRDGQTVSVAKSRWSGFFIPPLTSLREESEMHRFTKRSSIRKSSLVAGRAVLGVEMLESRLTPYAVTGNSWPHPELISLSFMPDGTNLGGVTSNLFATMNAKWATAVWQKEILRAAQVWAQQTNIN